MKKLRLLVVPVILLAAWYYSTKYQNQSKNTDIVISTGDTVTISYTSTINNMANDIIEKDIKKVITLGQEEVFNVLDKDLLGKKENDTFKKIVKGEKIYKNRFSDGNIQQIPLQIFKDTNTVIITGQELDLWEIKGFVKEITDWYVIIDNNPNYLDKDIELDITITNIDKLPRDSK